VFALNGQDIASQLRGLPFDTAWASPRCIHLTTAAHQATFHSLFATLLSKQAAPAEQRERLLLAYLNVVLAEILPLCSPGTPAQAPSAAARLTRAFQSAVEACYLERKQVQAYAAELGVTPGHLIEAVRQVTGDTPGHLLERRLLLEAKRLLIHTACSVSEIAAALSFTSASQFGRWFRHLTDLAPGEFRRQFSVGFDA
jgi:AraC-like DNA-binding protein